MATQSLYRRYRPRRFAEVKGQDHVVRALRDAVASGREGQAYLFSGPRGTGKTTSARILAKVLNCERPVDGEPCCECPSCLAVENGTSYDVHELDAASNNGVDAMRELIERASLGTPGRHKVYILDEVHMLSRAAEAALLKTLEEPPPHVVFVLATTDPQKVSETIRSRTQHLRFHLLPADTLAEHVRWIVADAGLDLDDRAIDAALTQGGGSARDTLSALELIATAGDDGAAMSFDEFVDALTAADQGRALTAVAHAISLGREPRALTEELIGHLRNGFLSLMAPELVQVPSDRLDALAAKANALGAAGLVRGIEVLGEILVEMRHAPDPRLLLEVAVVRLCRPDATGGGDTHVLDERVSRLEQAVDALASAMPSPGGTSESTGAEGRARLGGRARQPGTAKVAPADAPETQTTGTTDPPPSPTAATGATPTSSGPVDVDRVRDSWQADVAPRLKPLVRALYAAGSFTGDVTGDGRVVFELPNEHHASKCEQHRPAVEETLGTVIGSPVTLSLVTRGAATAPASAAPVDEGHDIDLDDLVDAPAQPGVTPIDRLASAFPGSELIDDPGD
jgi:DNA polymerase-3 subunit gamma/tau